MPSSSAVKPVTLVFVNYRSASHLERSLASLLLCEPADHFDIVVVNNDQREEQALEDLSRRFAFRLLHNAGNIGFGAAANRGALLSQSPLIGFINPDTLWLGAALKKMEGYFMAFPRLGVLGLGLLDDHGHLEKWSYGGAPTLARLLKNKLNHFQRSPERPLLPVDWVSGGALFVRREIFERLGGFDSAFFLYFEDVDLCTRVRQSGFRVALARELVLRHYGGASQVSHKRQKHFYFLSQARYFRKHRPAWEYVGLRAFRFLRYGI